MCYSTLIESNLKNLELRFDALINWESVVDAFILRSNYKSARIPAAMDTYIIQNAKTTVQKRLAKSSREYYNLEINLLKAKKKKYEKDCLDFEAKIKKGSKAKDLDVKLKKRRESIEKLNTQIEHYSGIEESGAPRVFPNFYAPVIVNANKGREIQLRRYHILPANGKELIPFKYNLFNARRDKLKTSKVWKPLFGKQHGIFPFFRFYESVDDGHGGSKIIYFESSTNELMWSASLIEECKIQEGIMRTHAAVTDEPPEEVSETGHDRCPIFLAEDKMDLWLNPKGQSLDELYSLLDFKTPTFFEHHLAA